MSTEVATLDSQAYQAKLAAVESALVENDLAKLNTDERVAFVRSICDSLGLNHLTNPFQYIVLNKKLTLYARKDATDQLRRLYGVSVRVTKSEQVGDFYIVHAEASTPSGRRDESTAVLFTKGLRAQELGNEMMKCETKAKRRVTLSLCGLGFLDETEVADVKQARRVDIDEPVERIEAEEVLAGGVTQSQLDEAGMSMSDWVDLIDTLDALTHEDDIQDWDARVAKLHIALRRPAMSYLEAVARQSCIVRNDKGVFVWDATLEPDAQKNASQTNDTQSTKEVDDVPF